MRLRRLLPSLLLLLATPAATQAQPDTGPTIHWSRCVQHLDWATATRITAQTCRRYPIHARQTYGAWSRCTRQSPHIRICVRCPYRARAVIPSVQGYSITVWITGYDELGTTASGLPAGYGRVAVDPSVFPLGTRFFVPGYGPALASDTGAAVHGLHVDLWFATAQQCLAATGYRRVTVYR